MAYDFLGLTNKVLQRVNEVPLTSGNFASASGFYADVKSAVNMSINSINTREWEWPFNHTTETLTAVVDQVRYDFPVDAKNINFSTFRVQGDDALGINTTRLMEVDYEEYLEKWSDMEYRPDSYHTQPSNVFKTKNTQFGIIPPPDEAYDIDYEYYSIPLDLEDYDDVPTIPEAHASVIHTGAMYYAYMFRGELEAAALSEQLFEKQVNIMRDIYLSIPEYVRSTHRVGRG